jgi:hypothetical protein
MYSVELKWVPLSKISTLEKKKKKKKEYGANSCEYRACLSIGICFSAKIWWNEITLCTDVLSW